MDNLYERVIEVLGKGEEDPVFVQFMKDLGVMPEIVASAPNDCTYLFSESGLSFQFVKRPDCFVAAFFHWASTGVMTGSVKRYAGSLAAGINFGDTRDRVAEKLGVKPITSREAPGETHEEYDLQPYELHCKFDADWRLEHFSVWYVPACFWRT